MDRQHKHESHIVGYGTYILVWLGLLSFTGITVAVAGMSLQNFNIAAALLIASIKGLLVIIVFMHLKFEDKVFKIFVLVAFVTLFIFLGLTFVDYSFIR